MLKKRATFAFPSKPNSTNVAVHILTVFNTKMALDLEAKILFFEKLVQVRNCIVHTAGLLGSYKYESQLRQNIESLKGLKVSNINFLGVIIEIETGFLESVVEDVRKWLPNLEKAALQEKLLHK